MAGPTCSVLLPTPLGADQKVHLDELLSKMGWHDLRPLQVEVRPSDGAWETYGPKELSQIESAFGWCPQSEVVCSSMIGIDPKFHQLVAEGAVEIARLFEGIIDVRGSFSERLDGHGTCVAVERETSEGHPHFSWVVDVAWLTAWIMHPSFRMKK